MTEFYEQKGLLRHTIVFTPTNKEILDQLSKTYSITQGEVVGVLLEQVRLDILAPFFVTVREAKLNNRAKRSESTKKLIGDVAELTPEQLAIVQATIAQLKSETQT